MHLKPTLPFACRPHAVPPPGKGSAILRHHAVARARLPLPSLFGPLAALKRPTSSLPPQGPQPIPQMESLTRMQDFMAAAMQDQPRLTALKAQILRQIKQPAPYYVFDMRWLIDAQLYASVLHETQQWWQTDACAVSGSRGFELKKAFEPCFAPVSNWLQPILTAIVFDASAGYLPSAVRSLECRTKFILSASACDNTEPGPAHVDGPVIIATLTLVGPSTQLFPYVAAPPRSRQGMNVAVTATDTYLEPGVGHLLIFFGLTQSARPAVVHRAPGAFHRLALITGLSFVRSQLSRNDALIV